MNSIDFEIALRFAIIKSSHVKPASYFPMWLFLAKIAKGAYLIEVWIYNLFFFLFLGDRACNPWSQEQVKNLAAYFLASRVKIKVSNTAFTKGGVMLFFFWGEAGEEVAAG